MPELVSMKLTPSGRGGNILGAEVEEDVFPLRLHLNKEEIAKLKLSGIELEDERTFVATVRVTSVSTSADEGSEPRENIILTVIEAAVGPKKDTSEADKLFGGS